MSLDPQPQAADLPGENLASAPSVVESDPGHAATTAPAPKPAGWRRIWWSLAALAGVLLGLYLGFEAFLGEGEAPPRQAARLPPEPAGESIGERTPESKRPDRLPLNPLVPESGAQLIAEAERVASNLVERFPQNPDSHEMLARFHLEFGDLGAAAKAWERCLQLNANYAYAHAGLAKIATKRGNLVESVMHWRRAILADPATVAHQIELGKALVASGEVEEAITVLEGAVKAAPAWAQTHAELGTALLQEREDATARAEFEKALELDPRLAAAHFGLATACMRLGQEQQAQVHEARYTELRSDRTERTSRELRAYDDDLAMQDDIAGLYTDIGRVYLAVGRAGLAEQLWRRAARLHPENRPCRQALARLMHQQHKPLESILLLRELARLEPENVIFPAEMARLYAELGRMEDGERVLREFGDSAPASAAAQRALAEFYLRVKNDPELAAEHAQKAAELSKVASDWALLSAAKERLGDVPAAIAAIQRASILAPDNLQYRQLLALLRERAEPSAGKEDSHAHRDADPTNVQPPAGGKSSDQPSNPCR